MTKAIPSSPLGAFTGIALAALTLGGCASTVISGGAVPKPKTVFVSDFIFVGDVAAVDRGYTGRLEHKIGSFPTFERKQRTNERVNDEIVATIIAILREAGLDAQPGTEEGLSLKDDVALVAGRVRVADLATAAKNKQIGFGTGRGGIAAEMTVSHFSSGGKRQLLTFTAKPEKSTAANRKQAAARSVAIDAALGAEGTPAVKLSPDTEAQARALGRAIGDKIVAFAREQSWLTGTDAGAGAAAPEIAPAAAGDKPVHMPPSRPQAKPAQAKPVRQITPRPMPKPKSEPKLEPEPEPEPDKQGN